jgi:BirA family biotin operon repressor/biotin-[acetyl-CoA-carboxylase] ligase
MHDQRELPSLPGPYELCMLPAVDSVLAEAVRRADAGAEEGTLLWASSQRDARTRRGHRWEAPEGNLHCATILRPDFDNRTAEQICTVAGVAAGAAIAELVAPMTGMGYRWPGDLLINELLSGQVQLAAPPGAGDPWPWLVVAVSVNVSEHPENPEPEAFNSIHDSGEADHVRAMDVLELYSRHFLRWINLWAEDGYEPVRAAWLQRARDVGENRRLELPARSVEGTVRGIGEHGELVLDTGADRTQRVSVAEYFSLS